MGRDTAAAPAAAWLAAAIVSGDAESIATLFDSSYTLNVPDILHASTHPDNDGDGRSAGPIPQVMIMKAGYYDNASSRRLRGLHELQRASRRHAVPDDGQHRTRHLHHARRAPRLLGLPVDVLRARTPSARRRPTTSSTGTCTSHGSSPRPTSTGSSSSWTTWTAASSRGRSSTSPSTWVPPR